MRGWSRLLAVTAPPTRIVEARFVATAPEPAHFPDPIGLEVAVAGRSNVGKSSLLNALFGRRHLARTSSTPGCTRQIGFYEVRTGDGAVLRLVDLPGYGYARRSKTERVAWGDLIESYLLARPTLAAAVVLVDVRRGLEADDCDLLELLASPPRVARAELEILLVATKLDRLPRSAQKPALDQLRAQTKRRVIGFSVGDPHTHAALWQAVRRQIGLGA
jgi:GTP-binding protein